MAANLYPVFGLTPNMGKARISAANTARDGSGSNITTAFTAGTDGSRIDRITIIDSDATASSTAIAQVIRFWFHDGTNFYLKKEILTTATAGTTAALSYTGEYVIPGGWIIPSGWTIRVAGTLATTTTGQIDVTIEGVNF